MTDTPAPLSQPLSEEPFWNRRWAVFEDEDHSWCIVTADDAAEYVVWPEMTEADVRRIVDAHNTVLGVARMPEDAARSVPDNAALRDWLVNAIAASTLTNSRGYVQGFSSEEAADAILDAASAGLDVPHRHKCQDCGMGLPDSWLRHADEIEDFLASPEEASPEPRYDFSDPIWDPSRRKKASR